MILFFDTETTGFWNGNLDPNHPDQARVVQLGAILVDDADENRREVMRLDVIVNAGVRVPDAAANVHGITTEISQKYGVNESAAYDVFFDMMEVADMIVAHNIDFDTRMLRGNCQRLSGDPLLDIFAGKPQYCTMKKLVNICQIPNKKGHKGFAWPKLSEACQLLLGRDATAAHQAIGDVIDCRDLYFYIQDLTAQPAA